MRRSILVIAIGLLGGCGSLADLWVRRNFSADTNLPGFKGDTTITLTPYLISPRQTLPPFHEITRATLNPICQHTERRGQQSDRDRRHRFTQTTTPILANSILTIGDMVFTEISSQIESAEDRLINEISNSSAAAINIPRLLPGSGGACYVLTRRSGQSFLWEFAFRIQGIDGAPEAAVIQPVSLVVERTVARTRDGGNVDMDITVTVQAPRQDNTVGPRGTSDFRLRGLAPEGNAARQQVERLVPGTGQAFVAPGQDRFAVIGVSVTEMGQGGDDILRDRRFRERHQEAVRTLLRTIASDRLGIEPLPGR